MKYLLLVSICVLVYFNSLTGQFVSDDYEGIVNRQVRTLDYSSLPALTDSYLYTKFGLNQIPYHAVSLGLHTINTVLVYTILTSIFSPVSSMMGALFFAVHPVHTEAVSWISGNPYLYYGLLCFSIMVMYLKGNFWYLLSILIFLFALPTHYSWYSLIAPIVFVYEIALRRGWKNLLLPLPYLFIAGAFLSTKVQAFHERTALLGSVQLYNLNAQQNPFIIAVHAIYSNFVNMMLPINQVFYREPQLMTQKKFFFEAIFVCLLISSMAIMWKKAKPLFWGMATFLVGFIPTYLPKPICWLVCDRYNYVPSIAFSIFVSYLYSKYSGKWGNKLLLPLFLVFLAMSFKTIARNEDYRTNRRFWETEKISSPLSPRSHNELARVFVTENNLDMALNEFYYSLKISPNYAVAWSNIGVVFQFKKDYDNAVKSYENAIKNDPTMFMPNFLVGTIYLNSDMFEKAIERLSKAHSLRPEDKEVVKALTIAEEKKREKDGKGSTKL